MKNVTESDREKQRAIVERMYRADTNVAVSVIRSTIKKELGWSPGWATVTSQLDLLAKSKPKPRQLNVFSDKVEGIRAHMKQEGYVELHIHADGRVSATRKEEVWL